MLESKNFRFVPQLMSNYTVIPSSFSLSSYRVDIRVCRRLACAQVLKIGSKLRKIEFARINCLICQ